MTVVERIRAAVNSCGDMNKDSIDKLISLAYYIGREEATRTVSDDYTAHIKVQKERAAACRYNKMAATIVGPEDYIYHSDYAMDMMMAFGNDETTL